ncbi:acyl-CoA N-acyltransferase [Dichotomocladium elegans]|nr:acyl-CoA N-acyltransferase [Dichotomocladium elegans]
MIDACELIKTKKSYLLQQAGGWTTEEHLVLGDRVSVQDMKDAVTNNGKPNILLFAFDQDTVIGTLLIQPEEEGSKRAEFGMFAVAPSSQSCGAGGSLMRAGFKWMKQAGYTAAVLHVLDSRPELLTWYYKLGFKDTGKTFPFVWPEKLKAKELQFKELVKEID